MAARTAPLGHSRVSLKGPSDMTGSRIGDDFLLIALLLRANPGVDEAV